MDTMSCWEPSRAKRPSSCDPLPRSRFLWSNAGGSNRSAMVVRPVCVTTNGKAQMGSPRFRYSIRGLMIIVAVAALAITWIKWTQRAGTFPVSGTISYKSRPVGNGKIVFLPPGPAGQQATGQIINGKYSLTSFALNDGAFPALTISSSSHRVSLPGTNRKRRLGCAPWSRRVPT